MTGADLTLALPEVFLAIAAAGLLLLGAIWRGLSSRAALFVGIAAAVVAALMILLPARPAGEAFGGLFIVDPFGDFMKLLVLVGVAATLLLTIDYAENEGLKPFELGVLLLFASLGMLMMISAADLISLYVGLELQSLALYVTAAIRRDSLRASEAGLKYFVLGALSSGMLLYGASMIYGFTGTTSFEGIATVIANETLDGGHVSVGVVVGIVFIIAGLAFKVSAVPFHMWTPDVYEGAPTAITAFFANAPKVAGMALAVRVLMGPFGGLVAEWQQVVALIALASMVLGALAAISQTNIKRLMAYSSIGHVGFALTGLAAGSEAGVRGVIVYMAIYLVMNLGTFGCILAMRREGRYVEQIDDLKGLSKSHPMMALALAILMFSMAGIPPLAGFFGKLYVFLAAVEAGLIWLAVLGVLASVIGAFYYLRIVKLMYFDETDEPLERPVTRRIGALVAVSAVIILVFFAWPGPLIEGASSAAAALLN